MLNFDYVFYRITFFYNKKRIASPETSGAMLVALLQFCLIIDAFVLTRIVYEYEIPDGFTKYWALPPMILLMFFNWHRYEKTDRYREFKKKWKDENIDERKKNGWLIVIYLIGALAIPILYGIVKHNIIEGKSFFAQ